jgi:hypothetical protein
MPYIKDNQIRAALWSGELYPANAGELNYLITALCHRYIHDKGLRYDSLNEVMGVLSCAQAELYRMVIGKYEDKKRLANGSVSELDAVNLGDVR